VVQHGSRFNISTPPLVPARGQTPQLSRSGVPTTLTHGADVRGTTSQPVNSETSSTPLVRLSPSTFVVVAHRPTPRATSRPIRPGRYRWRAAASLSDSNPVIANHLTSDPARIITIGATHGFGSSILS